MLYTIFYKNTVYKNNQTKPTRKKNGKSHEKALTEKGPRKRIMEKASTPPNRKSKKPLTRSRITEARYSEKENLYKGQESQRLGTPRKKTFTRTKNQ